MDSRALSQSWSWEYNAEEPTCQKRRTYPLMYPGTLWSSPHNQQSVSFGPLSTEISDIPWCGGGFQIKLLQIESVICSGCRNIQDSPITEYPEIPVWEVVSPCSSIGRRVFFLCSRCHDTYLLEWLKSESELSLLLTTQAEMQPTPLVCTVCSSYRHLISPDKSWIMNQNSE